MCSSPILPYPDGFGVPWMNPEAHDRSTAPGFGPAVRIMSVVYHDLYFFLSNKFLSNMGWDGLDIYLPRPTPPMD